MPPARDRTCPKCQSPDVARIGYGLPEISDRLQKDLDAGRVILGGCCVSECDPEFHCNLCGHEWRKDGRVDPERLPPDGYEPEMEPMERVPALIRQLYRTVAELEDLFKGRHFTLDGHLVGSIGEVLAAHYYGLTLYPASKETHDGETSEGKKVQVKATQGRATGLTSQPEHLLVLKLKKDGGFEEIYNGPGAPAWEAAGPMQKNGQRPLSVSTLRRLQGEIPESSRIRRCRL